MNLVHLDRNKESNMGKRTHDVIIIGGGSGGLSTAYGCAGLGMKTALIEPNAMGGDCLHYGCVPSKSLLRSASAAALIRNSQDYGLDPVARPAWTYRLVADRTADIIKSIEIHDSAQRYRSLGVEVYQQRARFIDPYALKLDDGSIISASRIVLATGSRPMIPPILGLKETGYITNLDVFTLDTLPSSLAVIGGGPIGVELGQALLRLGVKVAIIETAPHILPREDHDIAAVLREQLVKEGAEIIEGRSVVSISPGEGGSTSTLDDGRVITSQQILVAAGRIGNTEDLAVERAGIQVTKGFFKTDARLRTTAGHILAVGDCNGKYLFTHVAGAEASLAVRRIALKLPGRMKYHAVPWVTYTEPEIASVGLNEQRAVDNKISYRTVTVDMSELDRARTEGATEGFMKILYNSKYQVLGVQAAGPHVGELLMSGVHAVENRWKIGKFLKPIYPYPTVSEAYKRAASKVMGPKLFNPRVRRMLRLAFRYRGEGALNA